MSQLTDMFPDVKVLILEPDDILVISNYGSDLSEADFAALTDHFPSLKGRVAVFWDDVQFDALSDLIARRATR